MKLLISLIVIIASFILIIGSLVSAGAPGWVASLAGGYFGYKLFSKGN